MSKSKDLLAKAKSTPAWPRVNAEHNFQMNVYVLRKRKGWSQHELARRMKVAQPWVARHMAGYTPSLDSLAKYAHVFEISIAELVGPPMYFPPYPLWNNEGEEIGNYTIQSCPTISKLEIV